MQWRKDEIGHLHQASNQPSNQASNKPSNIDSIRGLACILLVAYHVVGPDQVSGLRLPENSGWRLAVTLFDFVRMPLFAALSGYLYASRRPTIESLSQFAIGKSRRLLIPLIFATTVIWVLRRLQYGADDSFFRALLFHYEHLWFLQALIVIFLVTSVWDALRRPEWHEICIVAFIIMLIGRSWAVTDFYSFNGAVYLFPYFLFGVVLRAKPDILTSAKTKSVALSVFLVVMIVYILGLCGLANQIQRHFFPAIFCGMAGLVVLMQRLPDVQLLSTVGHFSFSIYLWHTVMAAGARTVLLKIWGNLPFLNFPICFLVGLCIPIVLHQFAIRSAIISVLVTGNWHERTNRVVARKSRYVFGQSANEFSSDAKLSN